MRLFFSRKCEEYGVILVIIFSLSLVIIGNGYLWGESYTWRLYIKNHPISSTDFRYINGTLWVKCATLKHYFDLRKLPEDLVNKIERIFDGEKFLPLSNLTEYLNIYIKIQEDIHTIDVYSRVRSLPRNLYNVNKPARRSGKNRELKLSEYKIENTKYFEIHYKNEVVGKLVKEVVDDYYEQISEHLGFQVDATPITIVIAEDRAEYLTYGTPDWSSGLALPFQRMIFVDEKDPYLIRRVLPHEITHIIFHNYLGFEHDSIRWLSEGIAIYEELRVWTGQDKVYIKYEGEEIPLEKLFYSYYDLFTRREDIERFYQESSALVGYLINEYGMDKFKQFCDVLKRTTPENAIKKVYNYKLDELFEEWKKYNSKVKATPLR